MPDSVTELSRIYQPPLPRLLATAIVEDDVGSLEAWLSDGESP